MDKESQNQRLNTVRKALQHWDPIGVIKDLEEGGLPPNEYDSYAPALLSLLESDGDKEAIKSYLVSTRVSYMQLGTGKASEREDELAEKLFLWSQEGFKGDPDFRFTRYAF